MWSKCMTLKKTNKYVESVGWFEWFAKSQPEIDTLNWVEVMNEFCVALRRRQPRQRRVTSIWRMRFPRQSIISRAVHTGSALQAMTAVIYVLNWTYCGLAGVDGRPLLLILTYVSRGVTCSRRLVAEKMGHEIGFEQWLCWRKRSRHDLTTFFSKLTRLSRANPARNRNAKWCFRRQISVRTCRAGTWHTDH